MKSARITRRIIETLAEQHPNANTELAYRTPFELLAATMLSAQSTDVRVNLVTPALFARYPDAARLATAEPAELEATIVSTGFFRQKTRALIRMAQALVADHDGEVPADMNALTRLPGVGRNLKDHPKVYLTWNIAEGYPPQTRAAPGGAALRFTAPNSNLRNDLSISLGSFVTPRIGDAQPTPQTPDLAPRFVEMMVALLLPISQGELKLVSADYRIQPSMHYNYLAESFDRERMRAGVRMALELATRPELREFAGDLLDPSDSDLATDAALDQWLLREATTYSHISCTCRMGPEGDELAVVNQFGRVYGLEGLRVVDASIMPDLVRAPINPAVIMLAERVADAIKAGH